MPPSAFFFGPGCLDGTKFIQLLKYSYYKSAARKCVMWKTKSKLYSKICIFNTNNNNKDEEKIQ